MKVLITNIWLEGRGGTEVYVRDLAKALHNKGIQVEVYSPVVGRVAEEIRQAGIHTVDSLEKLQHVPDIIHAHHYIPSLEVFAKFPDVPAIYFLHDRTHPVDTPPKHSQIIKYVAVDYNCLDRLILDENIPVQHTSVLYNWVDTSRFKLKDQWSEKPKKALVFSNYARKDNYYTLIEEACRKANLPLDCIGMAMGTSVENPENILCDYDIVFAKAKAAIEAIATGANVIVCDFRGLGGTVTTQNYEHFRKYNFGMKILNRPIEVDLLVEEIEKYNPEESKKISHLIRKDASFKLYVTTIVSLYQEAINNYRAGQRIYSQNEDGLFVRYIENKKRVIDGQLEEKNSWIYELGNQLNFLKSESESLKSEVETLKNTIATINNSQPTRAIHWMKSQLKKIKL